LLSSPVYVSKVHAAEKLPLQPQESASSLVLLLFAISFILYVFYIIILISDLHLLFTIAQVHQFFIPQSACRK